MSVASSEKTREREGQRFWRDHQDRHPGAAARARRADLPVPALQHSVRLDEGDAAGRRLPVRLEIRLRLQPLSPSRSARRLFDGRIWAAQPERGDIVVFKLPRDNSTDYIKRVIGLPGDEIQMIDGVLYINGEPVEREKVDDYVTVDARRRDRVDALPRDAAERRQLRHARPRRRTALEDNTPGLRRARRPLLHDGRQPRQLDRQPRARRAVGYVPFENLVGRAEIIFFSVEEGPAAWQFWKWPWTVRWDRMFTAVYERAAATPRSRRSRRASATSFADRKLLDAGADPCERRQRPASASYQRLEFLGDRVLGLGVAEMLIEAFPKASEGELARRLTALVRNETCAEVALALDLGAAIRLGGGEAQSGGRRQGGDPRRRLRGGDRRDLSRRRPRRRRARFVERALGRRACGTGRARCATPRRRCRNGRRAGASARRPTRSSAAAVPTTRRASTSRSRVETLDAAAGARAARGARPSRRRPPRCSCARASGRPMRDAG